GTATGGQGQGEGRDARDPRGRPAPDRPTHRVSLVTWAGTHHDSDVGTGGLLWSALLKPPGGRKSTGSRGKPVTIRQHLRTVARHRGSAPTRGPRLVTDVPIGQPCAELPPLDAIRQVST